MPEIVTSYIASLYCAKCSACDRSIALTKLLQIQKVFPRCLCLCPTCRGPHYQKDCDIVPKTEAELSQITSCCTGKSK